MPTTPFYELWSMTLDPGESDWVRGDGLPGHLPEHSIVPLWYGEAPVLPWRAGIIRNQRPMAWQAQSVTARGELAGLKAGYVYHPYPEPPPRYTFQAWATWGGLGLILGSDAAMTRCVIVRAVVDTFSATFLRNDYPSPQPDPSAASSWYRVQFTGRVILSEWGDGVETVLTQYSVAYDADRLLTAGSYQPPVPMTWTVYTVYDNGTLTVKTTVAWSNMYGGDDPRVSEGLGEQTLIAENPTMGGHYYGILGPVDGYQNVTPTEDPYETFFVPCGGNLGPLLYVGGPSWRFWTLYYPVSSVRRFRPVTRIISVANALRFPATTHDPAGGAVPITQNAFGAVIVGAGEPYTVVDANTIVIGTANADVYTWWQRLYWNNPYPRQRSSVPLWSSMQERDLPV